MKPLLNKVLEHYRKPDHYTILVRGSPAQSWKRVKVVAVNYKQAVNKCCELHRNKWINYSLARKMDLITARVDAAKASRDKGKPVYIVLVDDEFELSEKETGDIYAKFVNGSEDKGYIDTLKVKDQKPKIDEPVVVKKSNKQKQTTKMETPVKKAEVKKETKKSAAPKKEVKRPVAAKKIAPKKAVKKAVQKNGIRPMYGVGIQLVELLKKGGSYTKEALMKKLGAPATGISFHLSLAKAHGHKIERTEKGYTLKK